MLDKIILAFYIDVNGIPNLEIDVYMEKIMRRLGEDKHIEKYLFPITRNASDDGKCYSYVECVYPKFIVIDKQDADKMQTNITKILERMKGEMENVG